MREFKNTAEELEIWVVKERVTGYAGRVAPYPQHISQDSLLGQGAQFKLPHDVDPLSVMERIHVTKTQIPGASVR